MNIPRNRRNREVNPALRIRDFYSFGLQVLNEINFARMHPDEFAEKLDELNATIINDNCLYIEGIPFLYTNLKQSLEDAINFLSKQKPLPGLIYNKTITQACDYFLDELIIHDGLDDNQSNQYSLENRLAKFGEPYGESYELIDYGMFDPEFIVINFILCDGDAQKYERNVIFNPKIKYLGIASSILPSDKICTVLNFCEDFYDKIESVPEDVQNKYKKGEQPKYTVKTIKNYSNPNEPEKQTFNNPKPEENNVDNADNDDGYDIRRTNSGRIFNMKRNKYYQKTKEEEDKKKQRGGTINIPPKDSEPKNEEKEDFRDDRKVVRKKKTLHEPKMMEVIEEENIEDEPFDREFKIESPQIRKKPQKKIENITNFKSSNPNPNETSNSTTETKYVGDKKITTTKTTKTETGGDGKTKTVTTTITEEVNDGGRGARGRPVERFEPPRFRNKVVKDPFKPFGRPRFQDPKDPFDFDKEIREMEKKFSNFNDFGDFNLKSPIMPMFEPTDDMFDKEDDIDMPEGAVSVEVKQKTITDSKGKPVLIVHKTIHYDNGETKTFIEKKNLVKK